MSKLIKKTEFAQLFCQGVPLLDVRAAIEYKQGAFPESSNMPLLDDDERQQVGICYKQQGQEQAIKLGHQLVSGQVKTDRIKAWKDYCQENPAAYLYCFRGGMRSHLVQQWLQQQGTDIHLIEGGYKAMRAYLLEVLQQPLDLIRISGQTGVGKTDLLLKLEHMIDLEGLANHRGSAFGKQVSAQPSVIDFENSLAIEILKRQRKSNRAIIVEDESRYIGRLNLPSAFIDSMQASPVIILSCPLEQRIERIYQDYVIKLKSSYTQEYPQTGADLFDQYLTQALQKIERRLGGLRYNHLSQIMQKALQQQSEKLHKSWISELLTFYYDPMYDYQLQNKSNKVIFTGNETEILNYLNDKTEQ
jgi:tRNA 2-selenouridine synthase